MENKHLLVSIDNSNTGYYMDPKNINRWSYVCAHGLFEEEYKFDIVLFNQEMPTEEGYFIATADNNKTVIVNLVYDDISNNLVGRCCYIDDYEAITHINSPEDWA